MIKTLNRLENREQIAGGWATPFLRGDEDTLWLATRYAQAFSQALHVLEEEQFVVICNVSPPLAQAITLGAWMAGYPVAYVNHAFTKTQMNDVLSQLGTSLKIGTPDCPASLENKNDWLSPDPDGKGDNNLFDRFQPNGNKNSLVLYEWRDDECAAVIFTSGSTGRPKGVCHSIGNLTRSTELFIRNFEIESHDRVLTLAPLHTLCGIRISILVPLIAGCRLVENQEEPDLGKILDVFQDARPTVFICGPIFIRQIAMLAGKLDDELSSIRLFLSTGAKLDSGSRVQLWDKHRVPVLDFYSLTETIFDIGEHVDHYQPELDILGQAFPGVDVELIEVDGISDPELTVGQIRIYSPNLFLGYLGEPLARKSYFDTGDLGMRDEAGKFSLIGRLDHGVKASSTLWLFPQAVEQLLVKRSDVADAHVRSEYDQYDRGVLRAKVVRAYPKTVDDDWLATLSQNIVDQLGSDYEAVDIEMVNAIQRTGLGKIIKDSISP